VDYWLSSFFIIITYIYLANWSFFHFYIWVFHNISGTVYQFFVECAWSDTRMSYSVNTRPLLEDSTSEFDNDDANDSTVEVRDVKPLFKMSVPDDRWVNVAYPTFHRFMDFLSARYPTESQNGLHPLIPLQLKLDPVFKNLHLFFGILYQIYKTMFRLGG
jgi:hypothetical protein